MDQSLFKKVLKDIGVIGISNIIGSFGGILLLPFMTKILGIHDYALYVQFTVTILLITGFAILGLPYATVRFLSGVKDKNQIRDDIYSSIILILIASLIISSMLVLFSKTLAGLLFDDSIEIVLILALLIPVNCVSVTLQNVFRVFQDIKKYTIIDIARTYSGIVVVLVLILSGYGIVEIVLSSLIIGLFFLILLFILVVSKVGIGLPHFSRMKQYLKFSLPTIPSNIASWITNSSDRYIIGMFLGLLFVGYYNPGYSLGEIIIIFMTPVDFVLVAIVAKYYNEQKLDVVRTLFKYAIKYYLLLAIPAFFGLSILAKPILYLLSTPEIADQSYLVTTFIAFSMILKGIGGVATGKSLYLAKKTHISMMNWLLVAAVNIVLNIVLIPKMGILGAAIATMIAFLSGFIFGGYFACKYFDFDVEWKSILKIIVASIIMAIILINYHPETLIEILMTIGTGFLIYMTILLLFRTISNEEKMFLKSFISKN